MPSDVDIVGISPHHHGVNKVWVVSCKSWQSGFHARNKLAEMRGEKPNPKRATWRHFRETWVPKWSLAFRDAVAAATGQQNFRYSVAVARMNDMSTEEAAGLWSSDPTIARHLTGCELTFLDMRTMWSSIEESITKTPEPSEIGRLAQL